MHDAAFQPNGPTIFVGDTTQRQALSSGNVQWPQYRVRNLGSAAAYFSWTADAGPGGTAQTIGTVAAPTDGAPASRTIGMLASSVEVFTLPQNAWFKASTGATFEFTPGEGV